MNEHYRPLSKRRRGLVLLLAVATAVTVMLMLLDPPGGPQRVRRFPTECTATHTKGCVGGQVDVIAPALAPSAARGEARPR